MTSDLHVTILTDKTKKQFMLSLIASEVTTSIKEKRELEEMLENV